MTVYVLGRPDPRGEFYLWADSLAEALAFGMPLSAHRPARAPSQFSLDASAWADAVARGAQVRTFLDCWVAAQTENGRTDLLTKNHLDAIASVA